MKTIFAVAALAACLLLNSCSTPWSYSIHLTVENRTDQSGKVFIDLYDDLEHKVFLERLFEGEVSASESYPIELSFDGSYYWMDQEWPEQIIFADWCDTEGLLIDSASWDSYWSEYDYSNPEETHVTILNNSHVEIDSVAGR
jgi:hypothetical protein